MTTPDQRRRRGTRDVGRERLLEAARTLFRSRVRREVSRQEIARVAGATPALLSYYFATNAELVGAATRPVIAEAIARLVTVLDAPRPFEDRLSETIGLFIDFARHNGALLDLFVETIQGDAEDQALIVSCLERLGGFFAEGVALRLIATDSNPRFLLLALWGMCRLVAELPLLPYSLFEPGMSPEDQRKGARELVMSLLLHGTSHRPLAGDAPVPGPEP